MSRPYRFHHKNKSARLKRLVVYTNAASWFFVVVLFASYLFITNNLATKGIERNTIEQEIAHIERQNQQLEIDVVERQSLEDLNKDPLVSEMVTVEDDIHYVKVLEPIVAVKQ